MLRSILINTVKLDLPVLRSNLTNRVQFYRDLSLEISIDLLVVRNIIVSEYLNICFVNKVVAVLIPCVLVIN